MPRNYHIARDHILQAMPGTVNQLVTKSGYCRSTVERWLRALRQGEPEQRGSHIIGWKRPERCGHFVAVHAAGPGKDAPCRLKPLTASQDWQKAKQKYGMETLRRKERARSWALKARRGQVKDPLMAWVPVRQTTR
jgi:hypothetical protein